MLLFKKIISLSIVIAGFVSCNDNIVTVAGDFEVLVDSLKVTSDFDKRENVLEYKLENNTVYIKTTDSSLADKVEEIATGLNLKTEITTLPEGKLAETPYGVIAQSVVNLRVGTSRAKGMATQSFMGQQLRVIQQDGDTQWYKVKTAQGYIAWIPKPSFVFLTTKESKDLELASKVMVIVPTTFAFNAEDKTQVVSDLVYGNVVVLDKQGVEWSNVSLPGNIKAVIKTSELINLSKWQENVKFDKELLVKYAYNYLGQPYMWGGNSFKGIDCSGFSGAVYYAMGKFLPRDASQQIKQGDVVEYSIIDKAVNGESHKMLKAEKLEIGDLLFFGNVKTKRVTHVAVWIGNNEYMHSSGKVHVTSVNPSDDNYKEYLVESILGVRRINGSSNLGKTIDLKTISIW